MDHPQPQNIVDLEKQMQLAEDLDQSAHLSAIKVIDVLLISLINEIEIDANSTKQSKQYASQLIIEVINAKFNSQILVQITGSIVYGLSLKNSDVDLILFPKNKLNQVHPLYVMKQQLNSLNWVVECQLLDQAKVPVLKVTIDPAYYNSIIPNHMKGKLYNYSNDIISKLLKFDLTFNKHHNQCSATKIMKNYLSAKPKFRRVLLLIKWTLQNHQLNNLYDGGISSYCLFLMMAACVQQLRLQTELTSQGDLLYILLQFYTIQFNRSEVINFQQNSQQSCYITAEEYYQRVHNVDGEVLDDFNVINPIDGHVISAKFYKIDQIFQLFQKIIKQVDLLAAKSRQLMYIVTAQNKQQYDIKASQEIAAEVLIRQLQYQQLESLLRKI